MTHENSESHMILIHYRDPPGRLIIYDIYSSTVWSHLVFGLGSRHPPVGPGFQVASPYPDWNIRVRHTLQAWPLIG